MLGYPLFVAVISLAFAILVLMQWRSRRRPHQLVWGIALVMAAVASLAYAGFLTNGSPGLFRLYYVLGALMMAAYLGMGSLYLALDRRIANPILAALTIISVLGAVLIFTSPINGAALHSVEQHGGPGTGVLTSGLWVAPLVVLNIFGAAAVIAVAAFSAFKVLQRQAPMRFAIANVAIAAGTGIISAAGSAARLGSPNNFWVIMAAGWLVIFVGFLMTTNLATVSVLWQRDLPVGRGASI
ncbi:MAG TPA: hypothetical protein VFE42_14130 [Chloroflexota bacterium]|nr:hypothetical protein [Chloroflexota bacterium]